MVAGSNILWMNSWEKMGTDLKRDANTITNSARALSPGEDSYRVSRCRWSMETLMVMKSSYTKATACLVLRAVSYGLRLCRESTNRQQTKSRSSRRVLNRIVAQAVNIYQLPNCCFASLHTVARKQGSRSESGQNADAGHHSSLWIYSNRVIHSQTLLSKRRSHSPSCVGYPRHAMAHRP